MPKVSSKIGVGPVAGKPMRQLLVDDPTQEQEQINNEEIEDEPEPYIPNLKQNEWTRLSPAQYNAMRDKIHGQQTNQRFTSTEQVIPEDDNRHISNDDANMLDKLLAPQEKKTRDTRNKVEILLGLRKKFASKEVDGHVITLRNLRSNQTKKILEEVANQPDGFSRLYTMKHMVVALALESIDGETVTSILKDDDKDELRIDIVSNLDPSVVDELYGLYVKEIGDKLNINSQSETKEVIEEIKK